MLVSYSWLQDYLGADTPSPEQVADLLTFHAFEIDGVAQVEGDTVIDVDVLPNRSSDCLSHRGIAREIAAIVGTSLEHDPLRATPSLPACDRLRVAIDDTDRCRRFTALLLEDVAVKPSPQWLQDRLRALGQRPINTVVDATNYVMYAIGQPMHAYDADAFPSPDGTWSFGVRTAAADETIGLLAEGGKEELREVTLTGTETLITDASSDTPIGLAGVKGGSYAGVQASTTRVIIEAANFDPIATRRTARGHNIIIDASKRFENEPARDLPLYAQTEIAVLLKEIAGARVIGVLDEYPTPATPPTVSLDPAHVTRVLGVQIETKDMVTYLARVGVSVEMDADGNLLCTGPWERTDLSIPEDFIEEIGRLYGYEHVPAVLPEIVPLTEYNMTHYYGELVRSVLTSHGFSEVITSSFRKKDKIKLKNALASDKGYLRSSLRKNVAEALQKNAQHTDLLGRVDTRIFEIGTVFYPGEKGVDEHVAVALGAQVRPSGYTGKEDAIVQEAMTAIESALGVSIDWHVEKGVAEADLSRVIAQLPAPTAYEPPVPAPTTRFRPYSIYPAITRDIAMWVPASVDVADVGTVLLQSVGGTAAGSWRAEEGAVATAVACTTAPPMVLERLDLFDTFSKDDRVSYAFRLVFQSHEKTLTDEEVNAVMEQVYATVHEQGWEVR